MKRMGMLHPLLELDRYASKGGGGAGTHSLEHTYLHVMVIVTLVEVKAPSGSLAPRNCPTRVEHAPPSPRGI